ncbi:MAG: 16S rRNA (cytosine(967)-C(5))-methyltransferase RsmB [Desulfomonile tiedjei]|nr:16S rRNA (cytosine(967)-C(5))-methyltransferase RsmB [Desulfomonile tiedjei]
MTQQHENLPTKTQASVKKRGSPAREIALDVLENVRLGKYAEHALSDRLRGENLKLEDRALATELVYGVLRWRDRLDAVINRCLERPQDRLPHRVRQVLRLAIYQIVFLNRVPDHAAVDQAVIQAGRRSGKRTGAFVNAVLRNVIRRLDSVDPPPVKDSASLAAYYSHPLWLVERWVKEFDNEVTKMILVHNNSRAHVVLRVNNIKTPREELAELLSRHGVAVRAVNEMADALVLKSGSGEVGALPGYDEGLFAVQDLASQMVAPLLGAEPQERILDACAAPGGKTAHLAALTGNKARIVAVDSSAARLQETDLNLRRLGVTSVEMVRGDSTARDFVAGLGGFDRVLLDAPCSNLGVLRHNPEVKYRTLPEHLKELAERQLRLLISTAAVVKPGGTLLYSVCTITPEETTEIIDRFLADHPDFTLAPIEQSEVPRAGLIDGRGFLRTFPPPLEEPLDGFFAARIHRL